MIITFLGQLSMKIFVNDIVNTFCENSFFKPYSSQDVFCYK